MPPNQKHTQAFTCEPLRTAQECITRKANGRESKEAALVGHSAVAIYFHFTCHCPVTRAGAGAGVKVIKAEDQKRRVADAKLTLLEHQ